jgi:hypothetical protein
MIGILDQFKVQPARLSALQTLIDKRYLPGALARGMTQKSQWISPPVALIDATNTVWVLWEVPDVGAWWNMRFQSGADPSVAEFWLAVDLLCEKRDRHYLIDGRSTASLAQPQDLGTERLSSAQGIRETAQYSLRKNVPSEAVTAWEEALRSLPQHIPGLSKVFLGRNLEGSFHAGDFTFDAHFIHESALHNARLHEYWSQVVLPLHEKVVVQEERIELRLIGGGLRRPDLGRSIKRTAYFRILPGASVDAISAWERDLLDMPCYMQGMTNWSLSRSATNNRLYVWEQEYLQLEDLQGEYMVHPHHWAHVDTWFDPEFARRIVDTDICHAFCESPNSILAWGMKG